MLRTLLFALVAIVLAKSLDVRDMAKLDRISGPWLSPDGGAFVFTSRYWNPATSKTTVTLWIQSTNSTTPVQLTTGTNVHDGDVSWCPDSRCVTFLSDRSGSNQLWIVDVNTMQIKQLTRYPIDIDSLKISPDGSNFAFSAEVFPGTTMAQTAQMDAEKAAAKSSGTVYDHLFMRHWDTFLYGKYRHLFVAPATRLGQFPYFSVSDRPVDLINSFDGDAPSRPFGGSEEFDFSPDGRRIAFDLQVGKKQAWTLDRHIWLATVDGKSVVDITPELKARALNPVFSPDGKYLAYLCTVQPGYESDRNRIKIYNIETGVTTTLTESWDVSADSIAWPAADPSAFIVQATDRARTKLFRVPVTFSREGVRPNEIAEITHEHSVASFEVGRDKIFFSMSSYTQPAEIYSLPLKGAASPAQLTHRNDDAIAPFPLVTPEEWYFPGANGDQVHCWFFRPAGFETGKKYPMILYVHGGPENPWGDSWSYRWNPQTLATLGWSVLAINFHGSSSFGEKFTRAILENWGGAPFEDLMKGMDFIFAKYSWINKDQVSAMGASYGGFMINWIAGHAPERFKALVCHDGVFDTRGHYYETEELYFPEIEFGYPAYINDSIYEQYNPSNFVQNWRTPQLIIQGGRDYRIPDTQAIAAFTALQRRGIPSKLLYFPEENHWVLNPDNSILWHDTVIGWIKQWMLA